MGVRTKTPTNSSGSPSARLFSALICALSSSFAGCEKATFSPATSAENHPLVGELAPDFDLEAQSGGERAALSDQRGKLVIVDFWATWCEPCRRSFPAYQELLDKYEGQLAILAISVDEEPDALRSFAEQTGAHFILAWDEGKIVAKNYRPEHMPTSYVIDRNGIIRYVHAGFREGDEAHIEAQLVELLK